MTEYTIFFAGQLVYMEKAADRQRPATSVSIFNNRSSYEDLSSK
ncbi:hypothetical protein [Paenibacillus allorhizoplanae]|nr:hypothetical protein [Paenibacillus allorhizoplanae]